MKLSNTKKTTTRFDPMTHWSHLLGTLFVVFVLIVAYAIYSFFYIKEEIVLIEIESKENLQNSTSTDYIQKTRQNNKFLKDINNLNKTLDLFEQKESDYAKILKKVEIRPTVSTSTATTTVATSTKQ